MESSDEATLLNGDGTFEPATASSAATMNISSHRGPPQSCITNSGDGSDACADFVPITIAGNNSGSLLTSTTAVTTHSPLQKAPKRTGISLLRVRHPVSPGLTGSSIPSATVPAISEVCIPPASIGSLAGFSCELDHIGSLQSTSYEWPIQLDGFLVKAMAASASTLLRPDGVLHQDTVDQVSRHIDSAEYLPDVLFLVNALEPGRF
ncbi:unnamed protein product [Protopolystoma xenopodis]|uniref:Uncharacterized protein n=1 Tax=Protopolystoma xenopodis TaxID=117903 RepID=A0A3S5CMR8_9PLAT|nr:unnamed protein product [Protopolystoma xenopodis]